MKAFTDDGVTSMESVFAAPASAVLRVDYAEPGRPESVRQAAATTVEPSGGSARFRVYADGPCAQLVDAGDQVRLAAPPLAAGLLTRTRSKEEV